MGSNIRSNYDDDVNSKLTKLRNTRGIIQKTLRNKCRWEESMKVYKVIVTRENNVRQ